MIRATHPTEPIDIAARQEPAVRKRMSGPAMSTVFAIAKAWEPSVGE